ncbi:hypothetical protein [Streptomyces huiliensis]|uniref:hypothetical protein n=1 Tax=Streptomyces huiliensis TaxID=2876027 RepID=UPI001CBB10BB|nr:hypothetical protein [Streptomyces huiliensis]MBZ4318716.1 hypothetical protein [Streptomyces huiliensis]
MSKRQKGRRHRRVNRTPRPVGGSTRPEARAGVRAVEVRAVEARAVVPEGARSEVGPQAGPGTRAAAPAAAVVPGLGRHEARTWDGLRSRGADGASVDDLCAAVGYQPRTILKHVAGLAGHGLAEQRGDRWYARTGEGVLAGAQGG